MENEIQPSAQATEQTNEQPQNEGIQTRINELTAKFRQAEEANQRLSQQLMEQQAKYATVIEQQMRAQIAPPPQQPPEDPLAPFKDQLDPTVAQAVQAAVAATQRRMEQQFNALIQQQAVEQSAYAVRAEVAALPNVPKEVAQRAEHLMRAWKSQGLPIVPQDAINFALGEYQRSQLMKAAPVMGYNPNAQVAPAVIPGQIPAPVAPRSQLPANFDSLDYHQQNTILEKMGVGDMPL